MARKNSSAASDFESGIARRHVQPPYEIERVGFEKGGTQKAIVIPWDRSAKSSVRFCHLDFRNGALDSEIPVIEQGRDRPAEHVIFDANADIFTDNNADGRR